MFEKLGKKMVGRVDIRVDAPLDVCGTLESHAQLQSVWLLQVSGYIRINSESWMCHQYRFSAI